jgi:histidinol-phosphate aminotransferase
LGNDFRLAAGEVLGVDPESILIGNGSDDILTILTRAFVPEGGLIASPSPSYVLYKSLAEIQGARFESVPFGERWSLAGTKWPENADLSFVPNPNSPTGQVLAESEIELLADFVHPAPLVLDEAYADFADWNALDWQNEKEPIPNLIVTRTLSKAYSLAGIRFGFAVAPPELVRELVKVKDSYNCDVLSLAAATAAIRDREYYRAVRAKILATRMRMSVELAELRFDVTPSRANFLWCRRADRPMKPIYEALKAKNVLVRYMNYGPAGDGLRISVGTDAEIDRLLAELRTIV